MRRLSSSLFVAFALAIGAVSSPLQAASTAPNWVKFSSKEGGHAVSFPAAPKESRSEQKLPDGHLVQSNLQAVEVDGRQYVTSWVKFGAAPRDKAAARRLLDAAAPGVVASTPGSKLLNTKKITRNGIEGRSYTIENPAYRTRLRQQVFVVGDRLVAQTYSGPVGSETGPEAQRFFRSLKLLP